MSQFEVHALGTTQFVKCCLNSHEVPAQNHKMGMYFLADFRSVDFVSHNALWTAAAAFLDLNLNLRFIVFRQGLLVRTTSAY